MKLELHKPPPAIKGGSLEISNSLAAIDTSDNNESLTHLQAACILRRFSISAPVALVTARLVYGRASA